MNEKPNILKKDATLQEEKDYHVAMRKYLEKKYRYVGFRIKDSEFLKEFSISPSKIWAESTFMMVFMRDRNYCVSLTTFNLDKSLWGLEAPFMEVRGSSYIKNKDKIISKKNRSFYSCPLVSDLLYGTMLMWTPHMMLHNGNKYASCDIIDLEDSDYDPSDEDILGGREEEEAIFTDDEGEAEFIDDGITNNNKEVIEKKKVELMMKTDAKTMAFRHLKYDESSETGWCGMLDKQEVYQTELIVSNNEVKEEEEEAKFTDDEEEAELTDDDNKLEEMLNDLKKPKKASFDTIMIENKETKLKHFSETKNLNKNKRTLKCDNIKNQEYYFKRKRATSNTDKTHFQAVLRTCIKEVIDSVFTTHHVRALYEFIKPNLTYVEINTLSRPLINLDGLGECVYAHTFDTMKLHSDQVESRTTEDLPSTGMLILFLPAPPIVVFPGICELVFTKRIDEHDQDYIKTRLFNHMQAYTNPVTTQCIWEEIENQYHEKRGVFKNPRLHSICWKCIDNTMRFLHFQNQFKSKNLKI